MCYAEDFMLMILLLATSIVLSSTSLLNKLLDVFHKRTLV